MGHLNALIDHSDNNTRVASESTCPSLLSLRSKGVGRTTWPNRSAEIVAVHSPKTSVHIGRIIADRCWTHQVIGFRVSYPGIVLEFLDRLINPHTGREADAFELSNTDLPHQGRLDRF